jgi:DNA-binding response OmpR family regulator
MLPGSDGMDTCKDIRTFSRKKIAAVNPNEEFIHSVYGVGYKYELA